MGITMNDHHYNFNKDGFVSPVRIFDAVETDLVRQQLEYYERKLGKDIFSNFQLKGHLIFPFLWEIVHELKIIEIVETLIGPNIVCWGSSFFVKDVGTSDFVPWHQDGTCWGLNGTNGLTVWLALTPSKEDNGCLRVRPCTHTRKYEHIINENPNSMLPLKEEVNHSHSKINTVDCILNPGEISIHHMYAIHGSKRNESSARRIGFAIRYIDGSMKNTNGLNSHATLIKGHDFGNFIHEKKPKYDLDAQALRRHSSIISSSEKIVRAESDRLMKRIH